MSEACLQSKVCLVKTIHAVLPADAIQKLSRSSKMDNLCVTTFVFMLFFALYNCASMPIYIGGFVDVNTTNGGWNSAGIWPAIELAKDHINQDPTILQGIKLEVDIQDSQCSYAHSIKAFVEQITSPNKKIALIGPGCSISAEPVADAAHFWNLVQVAYSAGTPRLSDKSRFPLFYRVNSPETVPNLAIVAMCKYFKWNKVAIVKEDIPIFNDVHEDLQGMLRRHNITIISTNSFVNDPRNAVHDMLEKDARIIIALVYEGKCHKLMCEAFKRGLYGKHIQWVLRGWYNDKWWNISANGCTGEHIRKATGNYIGFEENILSTDDTKTISGLTPSQLHLMYLRKAENMSFPSNNYAPYGYDTLWTLALALDKAVTILSSRNQTLNDFDYNNKEISMLIHRLVANTNFTGMSGMVHFEDNGDRINKLWIEQLQGEDEVKIGIFDSTFSKPRIESIKINGVFKFPDGKIPISDPERLEDINKINKTLFIIMATATCFGICLACGFLAFNIKHRKDSFIRMSSPHFNNLIIIGSLMCYVCVFLYGSAAFLDQSQVAIYKWTCVFRTWLIACGFTLGFGTMFVKTWRVYKIFTNTKLNKELGHLYDRHLVILLVIFLCVDFVILLVWQILDPQQAAVQRNIVKQDKDNQRIISTVSLMCTCNSYTIWITSLYAWKALLLLFGLFLAWETRNVTFRALNDSRYIGMCVYNVVVWACITVPLSKWVTHANVNSEFGLIASAINICTTSTLVLVFGPKVRTMKISPETAMTQSQESSSRKITQNIRIRQHPSCPGCKCE